MNIQQLAKQYADQFVTKTRANGDTFLCLRDDIKTQANKELTNLIYDAHDDFAPDDYKYQFIYEALKSLSEHNDPDDIQLEADVYTADLLKWVSSNLKRIHYCDEAISTFISIESLLSFTNILGEGQYQEKRDVLASVRNSLEQLCEEQTNGK